MMGRGNLANLVVLQEATQVSDAFYINKRRRIAAIRGFTLVELMITVVIAAILALIAYPMYTGYVLKAHRTAAKTTLLEIASREERYYSTNNIYATSLMMLGYSSTGIDIPTGSSTPYYHVWLAASTTGYTITASALPPQTNDTECMDFTLNSLGQKQVLNASQTAAQCWQ